MTLMCDFVRIKGTCLNNRTYEIDIVMTEHPLWSVGYLSQYQHHQNSRAK